MGAAISSAKVWLWSSGSFESSSGYGMLINGGQFVWAKTFNQIQPSIPIAQRESFKQLHQRVATSALHDSAQRFDPPRCHPNTREAILQTIFDWMVASTDREAWLMWLNGAAGAGKSAICHSTVEQCLKEKRAVISFFFSRGDPTRNNIDALVPTLVYQLLQLIPETADDILSSIEHDPIILERSLESQFQELFINPLIRIRHLFPEYFLLVVLDGLDESENEKHQSMIVDVLAKFMSIGNPPVLFLIASRPEIQISTTFEHNEVAKILKRLPLNDVAQASKDIHLFLAAKFEELKKTHNLKSDIPADWPSSSSIEKIVANCSGQFIYAALVMGYVSLPRRHPVYQLQIVEGIRVNPSSKHPLGPLDSLYQQIFSRIDELDKVLNILAYVILAGENRISVINWVFQFGPGEVKAALADLAAVVACSKTWLEDNVVQLLHKSLADFLLDGSRSEQYHINSDLYSTKLAYLVFTLPPGLNGQFRLIDRQESIIQLLQKVPPSAELYHVLLQFNPEFDDMHSSFQSSLLPLFDILIAVKNLRFGGTDDIEQQKAYQHFLMLFMQYFEQREVLSVKLLPAKELELTSAQSRRPREIQVKSSEVKRFNADSNLADLREQLWEMRIVLVPDFSGIGRRRKFLEKVKTIFVFGNRANPDSVDCRLKYLAQ